MKISRWQVTALAGVFALVFTAGSSCTDTWDAPTVEVEDCDAEDRRNREAECNLKPTKAPVVKVPTPKNPAPKPPKH